MTPRTTRAMPAHRRDEAGFSLTELIIVVVLLAMVMGALSASFLVALNGNGAATQRVKESNDAQTIAAFLVRDAQAAGGSNPSTGTADPTLGVSLSDAGSCAGAGTLVVRFKWLDRVTNTTWHTRVAAYYYDAANRQLTRQSCTDGTSSGALTLATNVGTTPVPTASCVPAAACNPTGFPDVVRLQASASNTPSNAITPYSYTLQASLRAESEVAPNLGDAIGVPLLVLGTNACPALSIGGNADATLNGVGYVNGGDSGHCSSVSVGNNSTFGASGGLSIVNGTCSPVANCPPTTNAGSPLPDPFASLTPPAVACASGSDPATSVDANGIVHYHPGTYHSALSISSTVVFDAGTYVLCQDVTLKSGAAVSGTGVTLFFAQNAGFNINAQADFSMSAPSGGQYANVLVWIPASNATTTLSLTGGIDVNTYAGAVYTPNVDVKLGGGAGMSVGMVVARTVTFLGGSSTTAGVAPPSIASPASLPTWTAGVPFSISFNGAGGYPAYTWTATNVPPGLTLDSSGLLHGTPTTAGSWNVGVTMVDSHGNAVGPQTFPLTINPAVHVTTASLPGATQGSAYSATPSATGGTGALTWTVTGALPAGLSFNGTTIQGTPTAAGTFPITIKAADGLGSNDSVALNLVVTATPLAATNVVVTNGGTLGRVDAGDTVTITFNKPLAVATLCAAWSNDANNQSLTSNNQVVVTINDNGGPNSHDTLTVASSACTFRFGVLDLGSLLWTSATRTFSGSGNSRSTVTYTVATHTLTVTLGAPSGATASNIAAQTVVYTPNVSVTDTYGNAAAGSCTATNQRF